MVVDDNPGFLETASKVLSSGGLTVVGTAATSADALARARETEPVADLITASPAIGFLAKSRLSGTAVEELLAESDSSDDR